MKHINKIREYGLSALILLAVVTGGTCPVAASGVTSVPQAGGAPAGDGRSGAVAPAEEIRYLVVWDTSGGCTGFALNEHPVFTYNTAAGTMSCKTGTQEVEFSLAEVHKYTLETTSDPTLAFESASVEEGSFMALPDCIRFSGFAPGGLVSVHGMDGAWVAGHRIGADGILSIETGDWHSGVYLIKTGVATYKILKR